MKALKMESEEAEKEISPIKKEEEPEVKDEIDSKN